MLQKGECPVPIEKRIEGGIKSGAGLAERGDMLSLTARGRYMKTESELGRKLKKCDECDIAGLCSKFEKGVRCLFQLEILKAKHQKQDLLLAQDPKALLEDLQVTIMRLEEVINYNDKPTKEDLKELAFLKMQLFEMVYGKKPSFNQQINIGSSIDIKKMMQDARDENGLKEENEVKADV